MKIESAVIGGAVAFAAQTSAATPSPIWPQPVSLSLGEESMTLSSEFSFRQISSSELVDRAITRYTSLIHGSASKKRQHDNNEVLTECTINVDNTSEDNLDIGVDESYSLQVSDSCSITAATVWGAMMGMETFTQLLTRPAPDTVTMGYAPVSISDYARFSHRGLMIDSSRHYLPLDTIKHVIDNLAASKFNVLHWHTVDAQSFPLDVPSAPELVKGAYSPTSTYTMDDLSDITAYARDRGVRVVYEVDVPGHAASWTAGYPEIMADCFVKYSYNINDFALNPTLDSTYTVVNSVLKDIHTATASKYVHIGGDEVVYGCWANDTSITDWMATNGVATYDDMLGYFVHRADDYILEDLGAVPVHWEEVFTAGIKCDPRVVFQVWTAQSQIKAIVQAEYDVIASPSDVWYLDHPDNTWSTMYAYDPTNDLSSTEAQHIKGGEVAMWSEHIDENNFDSIVYPRAAAVGERLWSPATVTDEDDAHARLLVHRCRLVNRGVRASPVEPSYCATTYV